MLSILAETGGLRNNFDWSLGGIVIAVIIIAAIVTIGWIALKAYGVEIPPWAIQIMWVVVVAFVAIVAIKIVLSMW